MRSFDQLIGLLSEIPDPRRAEGKLYQLPYVLLFSILAVVTGGDSYRSIETFITVHRTAVLLVSWTVRPIRRDTRSRLMGRCSSEVSTTSETAKQPNFCIREPALGLDPRDTKVSLNLAHVDIDEKSNEIPAAQRLPGELHVAHSIITLDALHCQKGSSGNRVGDSRRS